MTDTRVFPRILICAFGSGSGKTLITCALLRILTRHGFKPVSYKCGPDYIDPMFHEQVLGIPSRNLDVFLMGNEGTNKALQRGSKSGNFGVLEGVMGFYDGISPDSFEGSSYDICCITKTPAVLIVDCRGMSRSVVALVKGFADYGTEKWIKGIILNNVSLMISGHLKKEIEAETGIPVIGLLPKIPKARLESRHLGLVMPSEVAQLIETIDEVADKLESNLNLEKLKEIAFDAEKINAQGDFDIPKTLHCTDRRIKVGVARDEAFSFYYEDNLELIRSLGGEIVYFSPVHDVKLPEVSRIIIGGGYPELHAKALSENVAMRESILKAAELGMPIFAECGGFLYLQERLKDPGGSDYDMVGALSGSSHMTDRLGHFGYVTVRSIRPNSFLLEGESIMAHEYHYYDTTDNGDYCSIEKRSGKKWSGYQAKGRIFAGFAHLYYPSCPEFITRFLEC